MRTPGLLFSFVICLAAIGVMQAGERPFADNSDRRAATENQIAFLHLRLLPEGLQVIDTRIVAGHLKDTSEPAANRLALTVYSPDGQTLWQGWVADPEVQRLEYEDQSGRLRGVIASRKEPELMVRVPFFALGQKVQVARMTTDAAGKARSIVLGTVHIEAR